MAVGFMLVVNCIGHDRLDVPSHQQCMSQSSPQFLTLSVLIVGFSHSNRCLVVSHFNSFSLYFSVH